MKRLWKNFWIGGSLALVTVAHGPAALGEAFCSLRDPVREIYEIFPETTHYRSIVRQIDEAHREDLAARIPLALHYDEFGRHTLYVTYEDDKVLGYVQVRSEQTEWGLVEIAWGLTPELRVRDFRFQRCRYPQRGLVEDASFRSQLVGLDLDGMVALLPGDRSTKSLSSFQTPRGAEGLVAALIRCGAKTIAVTQTVWSEDLVDPTGEVEPVSAVEPDSDAEAVSDEAEKRE